MGMVPLTASQRASYERFTAGYRAQLLDDEEGNRYLEQERGFDWPTIARFRLGVVRQPLDPSHERFKGMIVIPNIGASHDEHPVGLKMRRIEFKADQVELAEGESKPKVKRFDQPDNQVARLWNLRALKYATETIYLCEGEADALTVEDIGLPAIAIPGANHMGGSHKYRERIFDGLDVVLCRDSDEAAEALVKAMNEYTTRVVSFAPHKDVNSFYLAEGPAALEARLKGIDHG